MDSDLKLVGCEPTGNTKVIVTLEGPDREALQAADARKLAIATGARTLGKCGFSGFGEWRCVTPPPESRILSDDELRSPAGLPPGTRYRQEYKIDAAP